MGQRYITDEAEAALCAKWANALLKLSTPKPKIAKALGIPLGQVSSAPIPRDWRERLLPLMHYQMDRLRDISSAAVRVRELMDG